MDDSLPPPSVFKSDLGSDWTSSDTKRQLTALAMLGSDWAQTRSIAKNPDKFYETNKLLGRHPSLGEVNNYFAASMLSHTLLANMLPPEYRHLFQYGAMGLEGLEMGRNKFKFGIGMTF